MWPAHPVAYESSFLAIVGHLPNAALAIQRRIRDALSGVGSPRKNPIENPIPLCRRPARSRRVRQVRARFWR